MVFGGGISTNCILTHPQKPTMFKLQKFFPDPPGHNQIFPKKLFQEKNIYTISSKNTCTTLAA